MLHVCHVRVNVELARGAVDDVRAVTRGQILWDRAGPYKHRRSLHLRGLHHKRGQVDELALECNDIHLRRGSLTGSTGGHLASPADETVLVHDLYIGLGLVQPFLTGPPEQLLLLGRNVKGKNLLRVRRRTHVAGARGPLLVFRFNIEIERSDQAFPDSAQREPCSCSVFVLSVKSAASAGPAA